ncbi:hypothetical protein ACQPZQ_34260 [Pseudonocardia sp. CA-142604]|uniref:hypothetical protein n=1 Tax=Pseudonocardia sp. CA-142604 TaxID=3240024 RepID=UPI003D9104B6
MSNSLQWEVTIPARTVHGRRLMPVPLDLPDGITGTIVDDGTEIVLTVPVLAPAYDDAIELARREATDLLLVLSSSFTPFQLAPDREFRVVPVGPGHTNTLKIRAWGSGYATTSPIDDIRRFHGRKEWPTRLRDGMTLFDAGQRARDEIVRFVLTTAAMEVLANIDESTILEQLSSGHRSQLQRELDELLAQYDLDPGQRSRLVQRLLDTRTQGSTQAIRAYLARHEAAVEPGDLRWWQSQRGSYLHSGFIKDEPARRYRLLHAISTCIIAELDTIASSPPQTKASAS